MPCGPPLLCVTLTISGAGLRLDVPSSARWALEPTFGSRKEKCSTSDGVILHVPDGRNRSFVANIILDEELDSRLSHEKLILPRYASSRVSFHMTEWLDVCT